MAQPSLSVSYTTTASMVTAATLEPGNARYFAIGFDNTGGDVANYQIHGSHDNAIFHELVASTAIAAGAQAAFEPTIGQMGYKYYRIQLNHTTTSTTVEVRATARGGSS